MELYGTTLRNKVPLFFFAILHPVNNSLSLNLFYSVIFIFTREIRLFVIPFPIIYVDIYSGVILVFENGGGKSFLRLIL
jgi:hypothetical protein